MLRVFLPAQQVLLFERPGEPVRDRFGDERPGVPVREELAVVQWLVEPVVETAGDSVLRTVDKLTVHVPSGTVVDPAGAFVLPDGSRWAVEGHGQDFDHGFHGWVPGVKVYTANNVSG